MQAEQQLAEAKQLQVETCAAAQAEVKAANTYAGEQASVLQQQVVELERQHADLTSTVQHLSCSTEPVRNSQVRSLQRQEVS